MSFSRGFFRGYILSFGVSFLYGYHKARKERKAALINAQIQQQRNQMYGQNSNVVSYVQPRVVRVKQKSMGASVILSLLLGPIGLLYSSLLYGLMMVAVYGITLYFTSSIDSTSLNVLFYFLHFATVLLGVYAVDKKNREEIKKHVQ